MGLAACPLVAARTEGEAVTCSTVECETCELLKGYLERKRGVVTTCPGCLSPGDIVLGFGRLSVDVLVAVVHICNKVQDSPFWQKGDVVALIRVDQIANALAYARFGTSFAPEEASSS